MVAAALGAVMLTGCATQTEGEAKDSVNAFCKGPDKVFVFKAEKAGGIFVIHGHEECAK